MAVIVRAYGESRNLPRALAFANTVPKLGLQPSTEIEANVVAGGNPPGAPGQRVGTHPSPRAQPATAREATRGCRLCL